MSFILTNTYKYDSEVNKSMDIKEYIRIKDLDYLGYCDYLQDKYGIGLADYMTRQFNPNPNCKRTRDGLYAHHKYENKMIMLSTKEFAKLVPFEWQQKENIVYCDLLEHLYLHILIYENPDPIDPRINVGFGGVVNFLVPELNDIYSGYKTTLGWERICHSKVINDKEVYLLLVKRFIKDAIDDEMFSPDCLLDSKNKKYGSWNDAMNASIYEEITSLYQDIKE